MVRRARYAAPDGAVRVGPLHAATPDGEIYSLYHGRLMKKTLGTNGRYNVVIRTFDSSELATRAVHILVCTAFHGPRPEGMVASHVNGDKLDNHSSNLKWETQSKNLSRRPEHGTDDMGVNNSRAILDEDDLRFIFLNSGEMTHAQIARRVGCSRLTVTKVLNGHRYRNFYENWHARLDNNDF